VRLGEKAAARASGIVDAIFELHDRLCRTQRLPEFDRRGERPDGLRGANPTSVAVPGKLRTHGDGPRASDHPFTRRLRGPPQSEWIARHGHAFGSDLVLERSGYRA